MTKAIIFDMDGTLFQTNLILEPALEATFDHLRESRLWQGATPLEQYRAIMGVPLDVVWQILCPQHTKYQQQQSNAYFQQALIDQIEQGCGALYEHVEETLQYLATHFPLYIASNGQVPYLQAIMKHYDLQRWIKAVYSIDLVPSGNKSELVDNLLREHAITSGFVVGDRASDIKAAKDNGLTSIGVRFDFALESELQHADYVVERFEQIKDIIGSM